MKNKIIEINYKKNDKTIFQDGKLNLGDITIFAGENNSGKTQIINVIEKALALNKENNVIKIPAEKVILENETKNTAKSDEFRKILENLISIKLGQETFSVKSEVDDIKTELPKIFKECRVENIELEVSKGNPTEEAYINACKEVYAKSIIEGITIKDLLNNKDGIELSEAGQGTERLVIVSLIRYLAKKQNNLNKISKEFLIIEEPEIFLHPKLKKNFNLSLKKLASDGVKIILTTHDPYFISLNEKEKIYQVFRDSNGFTEFNLYEKNKEIDNICHSEINYKIFDVPTSEYALLLYYEIKEKNKEKIKNTFELKDKRKVSLRDFRNQLSHPAEKLRDFDEKNENGSPIIKSDDIKSEDNMRRFIEACLKNIKTKNEK